MELLDDEATLAAVVTFLDEFDANDGASTRNQTTRCSSTAQPSGEARQSPQKKRQRTKRTQFGVAHIVNRNRARDRDKRELLQLREESEALSAQLKLLLSQAKTQHRHQESSPLALVWKNVAQRHGKRRKEAEEENRSLREQVVERHKVLQSMYRFIQRQLEKNQHPMRGHVPWASLDKRNMREESMRVYVELGIGLRSLYEATDGWIHRMTTMNHSLSELAAQTHEDARVHSLSPVQMALDMETARVCPFRFDAFSQAYWGLGINSYCTQYDSFREKTEMDGHETVFHGQFFEGSTNGIQVGMHAHILIQRRLEEDRVVVVISSQAESIFVNGQKIPGIKLTEQHWNVFTPPSKDKKEAIPSESCIMQTFGTMTVDVSAVPATSKTLLLLLTEYLKRRAHTTLEAALTLVEEQLLLQSSPVVQ
ncbi:hypothetical protein Poli38472_011698 [Pythium oligandrum]|uniref:M96 mating-specific protein family n=1 Tax=Pythium oligandrum TaxID=41045 RepID=A0A8K1FCA5_PYTOL|nr:hypothetical protein Poli38472_011698 [Pythium oligandrum]|eukprot:TMW58110.1 hypothetical protein Poli38472_011698 [Pythium oligandrum]